MSIDAPGREAILSTKTTPSNSICAPSAPNAHSGVSSYPGIVGARQKTWMSTFAGMTKLAFVRLKPATF